MNSSEQQSPGPTNTPQDDEPVRGDDPFWTDTRRAVFRDGLRRVGFAIILAALAFAWAIWALVHMLDRVLIDERPASRLIFLTILIPGIALFGVSVKLLVGAGAPMTLRILGVTYAFCGTVFILTLISLV